ncbi:MAG: UDP-galactopyranose mutase [Clostridium sp.]|jgi:UDP-galactopyranose mutase
MMKIEDIMSGDFSDYPEETQIFMQEYTEKLRESVKDEIIKDISHNMLVDIDKSKDYFINVLTDILDNGYKGLSKMSTRSLIDKYLECKNEEDFLVLLERVNDQV